MSRIGNNPIIITEGVSVSIDEQIIKVKGKLGEISQNIDSEISVSISNDVITLARSSEDKAIRSKHGLYRALIANMIEGVSVGHSKKLEFRGVGYRATTQGNTLDISVGYSHNIISVSYTHLTLPTKRIV